ncbi:hypothetical protein [Iningainema tapete]|uniref:Uncharacterized protein n=1 Tax=Iningainema tapete BLCC-T55 TaxID=2748662 RepID=A0A8J6XEL0_9CYAN|nr:hypothetical protein [Iningainema tapete]MBD2770996.1 hypothetical protein [Iningainema tapete BLCC-T55]
MAISSSDRTFEFNWRSLFCRQQTISLRQQKQAIAFYPQFTIVKILLRFLEFVIFATFIRKIK